MQYPIYDETQKLYKYYDKIGEYNKNKIKENYGVVLLFLNKWLENSNIRFDCLEDFKNIRFTPSEEISKKFSEGEITSLIKKLELKISDADLSIKIRKTYTNIIIYVLKKALKKINYKFTSKKCRDFRIYSIIK